MNNILKYILFALMTITISSCKKDSTDNNPVEPDAADYFPIEVGSVFNFTYSSSSASTVYTINDVGTAVWNVTSVTESATYSTYSVTETLTYDETINGGAPESKNQSSTFEITEDKASTITLKGTFNVSFDRYWKVNDTDLIRIPITNGGYIDLKKNVGIRAIYQFGNRWSVTYTLAE